ncbi:MAG TPA: ankyrin repeat domain-containing protein [Gemmatimonadaceae bacterium]
MSSKTLPPRPNLAQLKRQANELHKLQREKKLSAAARIIANHPAYKSRSPQSVLDEKLPLADVQLVIAREYGFESWAALKHVVEAKSRVAKFKPHPQFGEAVAALRAGDLERLRALLDAHPELVNARTNLEPPYHYFTGATLLHHIAWNPSQDVPVPPNIVDIARLLLDRGADVDALTLGRSIGTTMGLIITSRMASEANASGPLMDLLLSRGATLDLGNSDSVIPDWGKQNPLDVALSNYGYRAAEKMIALGAKPDICSAAALGRLDLVRGFFDADGHLTSLPRRDGALLSERDAIGLAMLFAYVNHHAEVVDFLLEKDGNWNMTGVNNGTAMHRAAWSGDLPMVKRLVAKGADFSNRENPFSSTPLSWAQHNKQTAVFEWLRANCAIDIHDAASFDLREHVEARLREDPASVNRRLDQWEAPRCTPLYWAAWTRISDVDGAHELDETYRLGLVRLLLDKGADPNIVAGDGNTPLDVANTAGAKRIAALIESVGGKLAAEL